MHEFNTGDIVVVKGLLPIGDKCIVSQYTGSLGEVINIDSPYSIDRLVVELGGVDDEGSVKCMFLSSEIEYVGSLD